MIDRKGLRRQLWAMAMPLMASNLSQTMISLVDTLMVGHLPESEPLAAMGLSRVVFLVVFLIISSPFMGIQALTARRLGEGKPDDAGRVFLNGLALAGLIGLVAGGLGLLLAEPVVFALSDDAKVAGLAARYLVIRWGGAVVVTLLWAFKGFLYGRGETGFDMRVTIVVNLLNVGLNAVFIWGAFGIPAMGMPGAAMASVLATTIGLTLMARHVFSARYRAAALPRGGAFWNGRDVAGIVRLSTPRAVQAVAFGASIFFFERVEASTGPVGLAASTVIWSFFGASVLVAIALGASAATMAGHALGAGEPQRAEAAAEEAIRQGVMLTAGIAVLVVIFPRAILSLFTDDPAVIEVGTAPLRLVSTFMFVDSVGIILGRVLSAAGCAIYVMLAEIVVSFGCMLPGAWLMSHLFPGNLLAMWSAWVIYICFWHGAMMAKFVRGGWKHIRI